MIDDNPAEHPGLNGYIAFNRKVPGQHCYVWADTPRGAQVLALEIFGLKKIDDVTAGLWHWVKGDQYDPLLID